MNLRWCTELWEKESILWLIEMNVLSTAPDIMNAVTEFLCELY